MHALLKHPLVDCDLEEAALWYNRRNANVADRLIDATQKTMRLAATDPLRFPIVFGIYRRIRVPGFRYAVYFKFQNETVTILALIHGARDVESLLANRDPMQDL